MFYKVKYISIMIKIPLCSRQYIRQSQGAAICHVCFEIPQSLYICNGPCQQQFCGNCISKLSLSSCPKKCIQWAEFKFIKNYSAQYVCPFDQKCLKISKGIKQFQTHCLNCTYTNSEVLNQFQKKSDYKCKVGHTLIFITPSNFRDIYRVGSHFQTTVSEVCNYCKQKFLSKSVCLECGIAAKKQIYCVKCRPIPCQKLRCPLGHLLVIDRDIRSDLICDFCNISIQTNGNFVVSDRTCNFDICSVCYQLIPEKHELIPLQNKIENNKKISFYDESQAQQIIPYQ